MIFWRFVSLKMVGREGEKKEKRKESAEENIGKFKTAERAMFSIHQHIEKKSHSTLLLPLQ